MIAGGLDPAPAVIALAKETKSVIITSPYDTFIVTMMINRALFDRLIDKELLLVEDIMVKDVKFLYVNNTIGDWYTLSQETGHSRFPVLDMESNVVGTITAFEVAGGDQHVSIGDVMNRNVLLLGRDDSVTHISRIMVWDNLILSGFRYVEDTENLTIKGEITQFMANDFKTASCGVLITLMNATGYIALRKRYRLDAITENFNFYQLHPVPVGTEITITAKLILVAKKHCNIEIDVYSDTELLVKGLMTARMGEK